MDIPNNLLTLILFIPTFLGILILLLPRDEVNLVRWVAFLGSLIPFGLSLVLWFNFNPDLPGFQFEEQYIWYDAINSDTNDLIGLRGGINWWLFGNDANLKIELGGQRVGGNGRPIRLTALLQAQLAI